MKKIIVIISLIIGTIGFKLSYQYKFTLDRIEYQVYIDGKSSSSFPSKGNNYSVNVECRNSKARWDYNNWKLSISNNTNIIDKCYIEFTTITNPMYLNQYIVNNVGTLQGASTNEGQIVNENGYRYEGSNPNNYILYNNELWRIIGVFETTLADGTTKQELTKIIRNESIGGYAFNEFNKSYWIATSGKRSSLNILLNDYYYTKTDGINTGSCYFLSSTVTRNCNYSEIGLQSVYRNMVENVTWNLGGYSSATNPNDMYEYERSTNVPTVNATTSTGYIGLMYPSDYGYSVLASSCARSIVLSSYNTAACAGKSWMTQNGYEWTISPMTSSSNYVWCIGYNGAEIYNLAYLALAVRPVLYLKSDTYIKTGTGTIDDPYILGYADQNE